MGLKGTKKIINTCAADIIEWEEARAGRGEKKSKYVGIFNSFGFNRLLFKQAMISPVQEELMSTADKKCGDMVLQP